MNIHDMSSGVAGGIGAGMEAFLQTIEFRRAQREGYHAARAAILLQQAVSIHEQWMQTIESKKVLLRQAAQFREAIADLEWQLEDQKFRLAQRGDQLVAAINSKQGADRALRLAEEARDTYKRRLESMSVLFRRVVDDVKSRIPGFFSERTYES